MSKGCRARSFEGTSCRSSYSFVFGADKVGRPSRLCSILEGLDNPAHTPPRGTCCSVLPRCNTLVDTLGRPILRGRSTSPSHLKGRMEIKSGYNPARRQTSPCYSSSGRQSSPCYMSSERQTSPNSTCRASRYLSPCNDPCSGKRFRNTCPCCGQCKPTKCVDVCTEPCKETEIPEEPPKKEEEEVPPKKEEPIKAVEEPKVEPQIEEPKEAVKDVPIKVVEGPKKEAVKEPPKKVEEPPKEKEKVKAEEPKLEVKEKPEKVREPYTPSGPYKPSVVGCDNVVCRPSCGDRNPCRPRPQSEACREVFPYRQTPCYNKCTYLPSPASNKVCTTAFQSYKIDKVKNPRPCQNKFCCFCASSCGGGVGFSAYKKFSTTQYSGRQSPRRVSLNQIGSSTCKSSQKWTGCSGTSKGRDCQDWIKKYLGPDEKNMPPCDKSQRMKCASEKREKQDDDLINKGVNDGKRDTETNDAKGADQKYSKAVEGDDGNKSTRGNGKGHYQGKETENLRNERDNSGSAKTYTEDPLYRDNLIETKATNATVNEKDSVKSTNTNSKDPLYRDNFIENRASNGTVKSAKGSVKSVSIAETHDAKVDNAYVEPKDVVKKTDHTKGVRKEESQTPTAEINKEKAVVEEEREDRKKHKRKSNPHSDITEERQTPANKGVANENIEVPTEKEKEKHKKEKKKSKPRGDSVEESNIPAAEEVVTEELEILAETDTEGREKHKRKPRHRGDVTDDSRSMASRGSHARGSDIKEGIPNEDDKVKRKKKHHKPEDGDTEDKTNHKGSRKSADSTRKSRGKPGKADEIDDATFVSTDLPKEEDITDATKAENEDFPEYYVVETGEHFSGAQEIENPTADLPVETGNTFNGTLETDDPVATFPEESGETFNEAHETEEPATMIDEFQEIIPGEVEKVPEEEDGTKDADVNSNDKSDGQKKTKKKGDKKNMKKRHSRNKKDTEDGDEDE